MTNEFERMVTGYCVCSHVTLPESPGTGLIDPTHSYEFGFSGQHGEILGWDVTALSGSVIDFTNIFIKLLVDGVTFFDDRHYALYLALPAYNFHGKFATCDVMATYWPKVSFRMLIPFEDSWYIKLYTDVGAGNNVYTNLYTRHGS